MELQDSILDFDNEKKVNYDVYLASKGERLANFLLDTVFIYVIMFGFMFLFPNVLEEESMASSVFSILLVLFFPSYWILSEYFLGKTPAKYVTRTTVTTENGGKPGFWKIVGRTLCRQISFEPFSFFGSTPVGWHDSISGTRVVKDIFFVE